LIEDGFIIDMVLDGRSSFHNIENNSNKNTHHFYNCEISQNTPEINKITNTNYMTNIETELIAMKSFLFEQVHLMKTSINEFKKSYTTIKKGFHYDYENEHPLAQLKKENEKLQEDIRTKNIIIKNLYQNQCLLQQQLDKKSVSNFKEYTNFNSISKNNDFITPKKFPNQNSDSIFKTLNPITDMVYLKIAMIMIDWKMRHYKITNKKTIFQM